MKQQIQNVYQNIIQHYLKPTPLKRSEWLSNLVNGEIYLKLESSNPNGSFKVRGAINAVFELSKQHKLNYPNRTMKITTASAGNHAQGVAYAAKQFGCEAHIFLPATASILKRRETEKLGAKIYLGGKNIEEALESARNFCSAEQAYLISPFNDENIILGQATCALEADRQMQERNLRPEYFICSVGGGGLVSGACLYFGKKSKTRVVGVEQELYNSARKSMLGHTIEPMDITTNSKTIADGIAVKMIGTLNFKYMHNVIKKVTLVSENDIYHAIAKIYKYESLIVEGAGAAAVAEIIKNPKEYSGKVSIVCISGRNIDPEVFQKVLQLTKESV